MAAQDYVSVVQQLYISYFGRPADYFGLKNYTERLEALNAPKDFTELNAKVQADKAGTSELSKLVNSFSSSAEALALYGNDNSNLGISKFLVAVFENVLGRTPELGPGWDFWFNALASGNLRRADAAMAITEGAINNTSAQGLIDAALVQKKNAVATNFTNALDTPAKINAYSTKGAIDIAVGLLEGVTATTDVTAYQANVVAAVEAVVIGDIPTVVTNLTAGADTVPGSVGNDIINGSLSTTAANNTLSGLDIINGGAGNDTLNILDEIGAQALPGALQLSNVENVTVRSAGAATINLTGAGISGVTSLTSTQSAAATLTAAATTNVTVSGATGAITVVGGKDVVVNDATADVGITIGGNASVADPAGTITVVDTKQGTGAIAVDGGTAVKVTSTVTAVGALANGGDIVIGANAAASGAVTVVQNLASDGGAADTDDLAAANIAVTGGSTVNVTVNAVSTAANESADGDIDVGTITVTGDGKTSAVTITQNGTENVFTKPAVALVKETAVVTFNAMKAGEDLTFNGLTFTAAKDLTAAQVAAAFANLTAADTQSSGGISTNGIYTGAFNTASWTSGAANGAVVTFTAGTANETDLSFTGAAATNDGAARIPTQVKTAGTAAVAKDDSANVVTLGAVTINDNATASIKTITLNGYGASTIGGTTATTVLETLNLSHAEGSLVVADTAATLALNLEAVGESGADAVVTLTSAPTTLNVKSTGNNYVDLTAALTETLNVSGTGALKADATDLAALKTVVVTGAAGLSLHAGVASSLTSVTTTGTTGTVSVTIDGSAATYAGGAGNDNVTLSSGTVNKSINLGAGTNSLTVFAGTTAFASEVISGAGTADTVIIAAADAQVLSGTNAFEAKITGFERLSLGQVATTVANTVDLANLDDISYVISAGIAAGVGGALNLDNMAVNGTLELNGAAAGLTTDVDFVDATGSADVFKVVTNVSTANIDFGIVDVSGIETLNLTVNDTSTTAAINKATLSVVDTAAKSIVITGNSALDLTTTGATALTLVDGSAMTGALTVVGTGTAAMTIKGGAGADSLTAASSQSVLTGGAGNDILTVSAGANLVSLNGGAGKDTYAIGVATNANGYATISGTAAELSGDIVKFTAAISNFSAAKIVLANTAVFQDYANEAAKGAVANAVSWFQFGGDTYIVQDNAGGSSFVNGTDSIVKITGLVDLTYNDTAKQLEIA